MQESSDPFELLNCVRPKWSPESTEFLSHLISIYSGLSYQSVENKTIDINNEDCRFRIIRMKDDQAASLFPNVVPIKQDYLYLMSLSRKRSHIYASLSRTYTVLRYAFGEGSTFFDRYKTSFCFPFLVSVEKEDKYHYILLLRDRKGSIEPKFARLRRSGDGVEDPERVHDPFPELSMDEMNYISNYISGFLESMCTIIEKFYNEPFIKCAPASLVLYGFQNGSFFDECFDNPEEYEEMYRYRTEKMKKTLDDDV